MSAAAVIPSSLLPCWGPLSSHWEECCCSLRHKRYSGCVQHEVRAAIACAADHPAWMTWMT